MINKHLSPVCTRAFLGTGDQYDILDQGMDKDSNSIMLISSLWEPCYIVSCCSMPRVRGYLIGLHQPRRLGVVTLVHLTAWTVFDISFSFSPDIRPGKATLYILHSFSDAQVTSVRGIVKLMKYQLLYLFVIRYQNLVIVPQKSS